MAKKDQSNPWPPEPFPPDVPVPYPTGPIGSGPGNPSGPPYPRPFGGGSSRLVPFNVQPIGGTYGDDVLYNQNTDYRRPVIFDGAEGDDRIFAGTYGREFYIGGEGSDTVDFSRIDGMRVTLRDGTRFKTGIKADLTDFPRFMLVENLAGTIYNDRLIGDEGNNRLWGGKGDDILQGGGGLDFLFGGTGYDWVSYVHAKANVTIDLNKSAYPPGHVMGDTSHGQARADGVYDLLYSIEAVSGSAYHDQIRGNASQNRLLGNAGNDVLFGRTGDDKLYGGKGDDILSGGIGKDTLTGGRGKDTFVFNNLPDAADTIIDFEIGRNGDRIDLHGLLSRTAFRSGAGGIHHFVRITLIGGENHLQYDADGTSGGKQWKDIAIIRESPGISLDTLLANGEIVI